MSKYIITEIIVKNEKIIVANYNKRLKSLKKLHFCPRRGNRMINK